MGERQGAVGEIAVALGSVAPTAVRAQRAEKVLAGARPSEMCRNKLAGPAGDVSAEAAFRERLRAALMEDIAPIADIRATAEYRRRIAFRRVLHNVTELWRCFE